MAYNALAVESLLAESADVVTIAEFVSDELEDIMASHQVNASLLSHLESIRDVMALVANQFS
jgi:hypothetical protein